MSAEEARAVLGVSLISLYRLIDTEGLRAYKIGRLIRLRPAEVHAWIESRRIQPGTITHLLPRTADSEVDDQPREHRTVPPDV
jgi:excisionase family DNA binding protein